MEIKVLIVDDQPIFGETLSESVQEFKSQFEDVTYRPITIVGLNAFNQAKRFILENQEQIDIMLFDYNIEEHRKGIDLFRLVDSSRFLIYKILHSITSKSAEKTKEDYKEVYNAFCYSKESEDIARELQKYEQRILDIKLYGNRSLRSQYYSDANQLTRAAGRIAFEDVRFVDILYAHTDGQGDEQITVYYRNVETGSIDSNLHSIKKLSALRLKDDGTPNLYLVRINLSFLVNLLWVAKIDLIHKRIRFILPNNRLLELDYDPTDRFNKEVSGLLPKLADTPSFLQD